MSEAVNIPGDVAAPDWSAIEREILCPLCGYNLRGLVEPRCPECGHRSTWDELLDPDRGRHPWLFEHRQRRRFGGFFRTFLISHIPRSFWRDVRPTHQPRAGRLVAYWALVTVMLSLPLLVGSGIPILKVYHKTYQQREAEKRHLLAQADPVLNQQIQAAGGIDAVLDQLWPYVGLWDVLRQTSGRDYFTYRADFQTELYVPVLFFGIAWPWLTLLAMSIFRQTVRQAAVKSIHLLRCTIYSADATILLGLMVICVLHVTAPDTEAAVGIYGGGLLHPEIVGLLLMCEAVLAYRLLIAYTRYLALPQAALTVLASQLVVVMLMLTIYAVFLPV